MLDGKVMRIVISRLSEYVMESLENYRVVFIIVL